MKTRTNDGITTFQIAVAYAPTRMIQFLINQKEIDINESDDLGNTALHIASKNANLEQVEFLVKNGAKLNQSDKKIARHCPSRSHQKMNYFYDLLFTFTH